MADAPNIIPPAVLRGLGDKLYEKRKNYALELEGIVKQLALAGEHEKIGVVINLLTTEFIYSPQVNHRKGGLIALAGVTVGLAREAAQHLEINEFVRIGEDQLVLYYADILVAILPFISDKEEKIRVINEFVRIGGDQLVPYYADILGANLPLISDKEEKMRVINEFVRIGGDQLVPYYADILGAILPVTSDKEEKIRVVRD